MLDFLCASSPRYDTGDKDTSTPLPAPTVPGLLDGLGLSMLFAAPTPAYVGQAPTSAASSSPGLLCWLVGSPTPHYQAATPKPPKPAQQRGITGR